MSLKRLRSRLSELQPIAAELNKASDAFTVELKTLEADLSTLNIGIEVELPEPFYVEHAQHEYDQHSEEISRSFVPEYRLVYGKIVNHWRIAVRCLERESVWNGKDRYVQTWDRPLVDASRELRIAAVEHIGTLIDAIAVAAKEKLATVKKVTDDGQLTSPRVELKGKS
ncbi:MAG TPA: hypothetical protein VN812_11550 [Candidatus Acidoferrales bacterium]|nr:hypothetical protein [Candidatus Acidoferrales bacterium]